MARGRENDYRSSDLGRSTSRERERDRSPMRGRISDLDLTSVPETVNARIFVGCLIPSITKEHIEDHFSRWGNVVGVSLTKHNFGFVQFENPMEAQACLASGFVTIIDGHRLEVKPAKNCQAGNPPPPPGMVGGGGANAVPNSWGLSSRGGLGSGREPSSRDDYFDSYYRGASKRQEPEPSPYGVYYHDYYSSRGGSSGISSHYRGNLEPHGNSRVCESSSYSLPPDPLDPLDPLRPNDVEIVVPNKMQRSYAENIEMHLKRMSLLVDLLFPPPDISPARVVSDLSARRCLYAIFATPENEKHNSLTLNILHGDPQEHRNMPVDDALRLIQRDFEDYVKKTRLRNMREVVPRDVRNLLLDLLEMRPLSMGDLDKLIKYLRERQNTLVDDQIEQKREIAGTQAAPVMASDMAVTYPGYNYITATVPGAVSGTNQTTLAAQHPGILSATPGGPAAVAQQNPLNIVSSTNAAAAVAAYPATAYTGMPASSLIAVMTQQPQIQTSLAQIMSAGHPLPAVAPGGALGAPQKQSDLQERILSLMKSQGGVANTGMQLHSGVSSFPPPTGVPPPSVVPGARLLQQPQPMWIPQVTRCSDTGIKSPQHGGQAAYSPWSQ